MSSEKPFKPMLAGKVDFDTLTFPRLASPKIDGLRATVHNGVAYSRSMKPLPNAYFQSKIAQWSSYLNGLDGEVVVGMANDQNAMQNSTSGIMSEDGEPDFTFYVFDVHSMNSTPYVNRLLLATQKLSLISQHANAEQPFKLLPHEHIHTLNQLTEYEQRIVGLGYEGVMLRDPNGLYKNGRSTTRGGELLKVKRYEDDEAEIIGFEEEMHNGNEATVGELGQTKRSSHKENLTGKGTMGAVLVRGITGQFTGVEFSIGTGFDAAQRALWWKERENLLGSIVTYKHFPIGVKDKPRHPVFKSLRDKRDMSA